MTKEERKTLENMRFSTLEQLGGVVEILARPNLHVTLREEYTLLEKDLRKFLEHLDEVTSIKFEEV